MRNSALAVLVLGALTMIGNTPAKAYGSRHAFCLQGDESPGLSACTYDSYAQCLASASGRPLYCIANAYFIGASDDPYAYSNRNRPFPAAPHSLPAQCRLDALMFRPQGIRSSRRRGHART